MWEELEKQSINTVEIHCVKSSELSKITKMLFNGKGLRDGGWEGFEGGMERDDTVLYIHTHVIHVCVHAYTCNTCIHTHIHV